MKNITMRLLLSAVAAAAVTVLDARAQSAPSSYTTGYRYDAGGRLLGTIFPSPGGTSAPFLATRNVYNTLGEIDHVDQGSLSAWQSDTVPPNNWGSAFTVIQTTTYTYDAWGRKLTEKNSGYGTTLTLTQYSYDSNGRVTCVAQRMNTATFATPPADACTLGTEGTQGPDRITTTSYDVLDRPLVIMKAYGTPLAYTYATYTYYTGGPLQNVTDANGNTTSYAYDTNVRLQRWYFPSPTTKGSYNPADYEEYGYDAAGQRTSLRKRDGNVITYDYDDLGRVKDELYPSGTIRNVYNTYDLRGLQLTTSFDAASPTIGLTQAYDGFGHLASATTNQSGTVRTLTYLYDAEGNRTRITHPDGNYFLYAYDGMDRLTGILENGSTSVISQTYGIDGRRQALNRGASVAATSFGYDGVGRLTSLSNNLQGTAYDDSRTFTYNPASQVLTRTLTNATFGFTQVQSANTNYAVNGLNQYTAFTGASVASPTYDGNGNMTYDGLSTFKYDVLNRLVSSTGFRTINMAYDPKGRLFQSVGPNDSSQFLYDGDALVAEYDTSGNLKRRYVHGSGVDEPLVGYEGATVSASLRRYYFADQQGSVVATSDSAGNETQLNTYDPYGVPASGNTSRFQYTGQIYLPDLMQYYFKARIYNPRIGRFLQTDPIGYKDDIDFYAYVGNDPMNRVDPLGLSCKRSGDSKEYTCQIDVVLDKQGNAVSRESLSKADQTKLSNFEKNYTDTVNTLQAHGGQTAEIKMGSNPSVTASDVASLLAARKLEASPGNHVYDGASERGMDSFPTLTRIYAGELTYATPGNRHQQRDIAHEGLHNGWNDVVTGANKVKEWDRAHQGPYNRAASDLLGF